MHVYVWENDFPKNPIIMGKVLGGAYSWGGGGQWGSVILATTLLDLFILLPLDISILGNDWNTFPFTVIDINIRSGLP